MNDILSLNINFEKHVLELRTEEFEEIKTIEENGNQIVEFAVTIKSFVLVINKGGEVIDYFWRE